MKKSKMRLRVKKMCCISKYNLLSSFLGHGPKFYLISLLVKNDMIRDERPNVETATILETMQQILGNKERK